MNIFSYKSIAGLFCSLCILLCSSCFEITEEIDIAADGSGSFRLTINASESKSSLIQYMKLDEVEGHPIPSRMEIEQNLVKVKGLVSMINGMDNVKLEKDFENFIFKISGSFKDVSILNLAMRQVALGFDSNALPYLEKAKINISENSIHRTFDVAETDNIYPRLNSTGQYIMETARVKSIMRLGRPIQKVSNPNSKLSPSKKSVMLSATLAELSTAQSTLDNKISY